MKPIDNSIIERQLRWRYATKKFDSTRRIPQADWATLVSSVNLAPSSFGMQPWRFVVVEDMAIRKILRDAAWNQSQVTEASHFLVCAAKVEIGRTEVEAIIARTAEIQARPESSLSNYQEFIHGFISKPDFDTEIWATHQVYLALGMLLSTAAMLGIDACPMEGFDPVKFDDVLNLSAKGYSAKAACALGYRSAEDENSQLPKVRYEVDEVVISV